MDLIDLRCFVQLANERNFTRSAATLNMTQSALSRRIASLEQSLGVTLVFRAPGRFELTEAGHALLPRASHIVAEVDSARRALTQRRNQSRRTIRVGVPGTLAGVMFPDLLVQYRSEDEETALHVIERRTPELLQGLNDEQLDLAIIFSPHEQTDRPVTPLFVTPLVAVVPVNSEFAKHDSIDLAALRDQLFVFLSEPGEPFSVLINELCIEAGFLPEPILTGLDPRTTAHIVAAEAGVSLMSFVSANSIENDQVKVVPLAGVDDLLSVSLVTASHQPNESVARFRTIVKRWALSFRRAHDTDYAAVTPTST